MKLAGLPLELAGYRGESITNRQFVEFDLTRMDRYYLPRALTTLVDQPPTEWWEFIEDDNRGAVSPHSIATLDGKEFFLSVKGVGSTLDPYSWRSLDRAYAAELTGEPAVRERLQREPANGSDRIITGELWLRGSPYGGQGLEHARTALRVSETADLTSIGGFLIAPVVKICLLPLELEEQLRSIHWYRHYRGRMVQELRLVPSNIRIYFHAKNTVGNNVANVFDLFSIDSNDRALRFETNFVRSGMAMLTLFARTLTRDDAAGNYRGLDFHDVWLDKDAVVAPNGAVYFVDLEGIEEIAVDRAAVKEKIEDQIYRSLYELTFAYEALERERARRFGDGGARKPHFEGILRAALRDDRFVRVREDGPHRVLEIQTKCQEESLVTRFPAVDG
ncbi:MAG: hypothetical protein WA547_04425 [Thermoplasmata archaeon]